MSEQTIMPSLDWEDTYTPRTSAGRPADFLPPSITETRDLLPSFQTPVGPETSTFFRSFKVRPRLVKTVRPEIEEVTLLEKWEGHVSEILPDGFRASLRRNASDFQEVVAEFEFSELADDDQKILAEGMPLVWSIVRERRNGVVQRSSILMLRRQPRGLVPENQDFAKRLNEWIHPDGSESTST